jgi:hypothetical protein
VAGAPPRTHDFDIGVDATDEVRMITTPETTDQDREEVSSRE